MQHIRDKLLKDLILAYSPFSARWSQSGKYLRVKQKTSRDWPKSIYLFQLRRNPKTKDLQPVVHSVARYRGKSKIAGGHRTRVFQRDIFEESVEETLIGFPRNKSKQQKKVETLFATLENSDLGISLVEEFFNDSISSSYAGIRMGLPVIAGETIISESSIINSLIEVKEGYLKGLRLYYDLAPEVRKDSVLGEQSFSWNRASIGYSFSFLLPSLVDGLLNTIDIGPKIGILNFNSNFLLEAAGDQFLLDFSVDGEATPGFEAGLNLSYFDIESRIWFGTDGTQYRQNENSQVLPRIGRGVDLIYNAYTFLNRFDLAISFFATGEKLSLQRNSEPGNETSIRSLSFNLGFVGSGVLISW